MACINYVPLAPQHFDAIIKLANAVHGDGYMDDEKIRRCYQRSFSKNINCSFVALAGEQLLGFRLTFAAEHWQPDQWCTPDKWPVPADKVCYFKCATVAPDTQGQGIGSTLMRHAIAAARQQGAQAGLAHIWRQSPGNAAFRYFSRCGGYLIKDHLGKWNEESRQGYHCVFCGYDCQCVAAEMLLLFDDV